MGCWARKSPASFSTHDGFDADAFAIAVGLVTGGGQFLLLTPPLTQWQASGSRFLRRLAGLLEKSAPYTCLSDVLPAEEDHAIATAEQVKIIEALRHVVHGHRKRPLVVVADRGRESRRHLAWLPPRCWQKAAELYW